MRTSTGVRGTRTTPSYTDRLQGDPCSDDALWLMPQRRLWALEGRPVRYKHCAVTRAASPKAAERDRVAQSAAVAASRKSDETVYTRGPFSDSRNKAPPMQFGWPLLPLLRGVRGPACQSKRRPILLHGKTGGHARRHDGGGERFFLDLGFEPPLQERDDAFF